MTYACIFLPFPPSTNRYYGARGYLPPQVKQWKVEAYRVLGRQDVETVEGPVRATYSFGRPDKRKRDLCNYFKALNDFLQEAGIIEDDHLIEEIVARWNKHVIGVRVEVESVQHNAKVTG